MGLGKQSYLMESEDYFRSLSHFLLCLSHLIILRWCDIECSIRITGGASSLSLFPNYIIMIEVSYCGCKETMVLVLNSPDYSSCVVAIAAYDGLSKSLISKRSHICAHTKTGDKI